MKPVGRPESIEACPKSSPTPEEVERAPVVDELDGAAAHDAQVLDGLGALGEDRRAGRVDLDLGRRRDARDVASGSSASNGG